MSQPDMAWAEVLTHQSCAAGKHADWWVDSEHNHPCPWCERDGWQARADYYRRVLRAAAEGVS